MSNRQKKSPGCLTVILVLVVLNAVSSLFRTPRNNSEQSMENTASVREVPAAVSFTETESEIITEPTSEPETVPETEAETIPETDAPTVPETEPATEAATQVTIVPPDVVTPEFKELMDSYRAFFEQYVEFMRVYTVSENPFELLGQYTEFMLKYTDALDKLDSIDEEILSPADDAYYLETLLYIEKLLLDSSFQMIGTQ